MFGNDITLCASENCEKRESCVRAFLKPDSIWQSYADFKEDCEKSDFRNYICVDDYI